MNDYNTDHAGYSLAGAKVAIDRAIQHTESLGWFRALKILDEKTSRDAIDKIYASAVESLRYHADEIEKRLKA